MREKFRRFMAGRYGTDALNQFLSILAVVLILLGLITRFGLFTWLALAALIYCYSAPSAGTSPAATEENYKFYSFRSG